MSIVNQHDDYRYYPTPPGLNNPLVGLKVDIVKNGGNWVKGQSSWYPHPYVTTHAELFYGYFKWYLASNPGIFGYSHHTFTSYGGEFNANHQIALINKLQEAWKGGDFSAGNNIGELGQTINGLAGLLHDLRRVLRGEPPRTLRSLRNKSLKQAHRESFARRRGLKPKKNPNPFNFMDERNKSIGDRNLEFQFGVRPLIDDIFEAAQVAARLSVRKRRVRVKKKGKPGYLTYSGDCEATGTFERSRSIVAYFEQEATVTEAFGLDNPAGILWEIMPWSFVIDWVAPIGAFISAQNFALSVKGTFITTDWEYSRVSANSKSGPSAADPRYIVEEVYPTKNLAFSVNRTISSSLDVPLPEIKSSLLGGKPLERLANALSLLNGLVSKK